MTPRFSVTFGYFTSPGSLRTVAASLPSRYSITSISPEGSSTSLKPRLSSATPTMLTSKLWFGYGLSRWTATLRNLPLDVAEIAVDLEVVDDRRAAPDAG